MRLSSFTSVKQRNAFDLSHSRKKERMREKKEKWIDDQMQTLIHYLNLLFFFYQFDFENVHMINNKKKKEQAQMEILSQ